MSKVLRAPRWPLCLALATGLLVGGCARPARKPSGERVALSIYLPCMISGPLRKVISGYETAHPEVEVWAETEKPLALVGEASAKQRRPAVVITMGEKEMGALVHAGVVAPSSVRDIAVNTYPLAVIVPAKGAARIQELEDLASPAVQSIYLEDPARSTLGDRAKRGFEQLGLWDGISSKLVSFDPEENVLDQLLEGKAEAAVIFKDCLFAEGGAPPKTVRVVGELPSATYAPITYQAAALSTAPKPEVAQQFVEYLTSPGGREALQRAGLTPPKKR